MLPVYQITHMLKTQGQTSTLTKVSSGSYDPATGTNSGGAQEAYNIKAYFAQFNLMEDSNVVSGSRSVLVGTVDTSGVTLPEPETSDLLTGVSGDDSVILSVQKIFSGDTVVCYLCEVEE
jgi:hypothetical protein